MKKYNIFILMIFPVVFFSQVTIGKNGNSPTNNSVLLEFGEDGDKGIVLPYVRGEVTNAVPGTLIYDVNVFRVKVRTEIGWVDLSGEDGTADLNPQLPLASNPFARTVIGDAPVAGDPDTDVPGILVLNSKSKLFVLPKVYDYTKVIDPAPGMIVYQTKDDFVAVFNGSTWSFWRP